MYEYRLVPFVALAWIPFAAHGLLGDQGVALAVFHALTGWWTPLAGAVFAACLFFRAWRAAAATAPLVVLWALWTLPGTVSARPQAGPVQLRIVSANVLMVHPDPPALRDEILRHDPDVVLLQEVSARWVEAFEAMKSEYPHQYWLPEEHSFGQGIVSKRPLLQTTQWTLEEVPMVEVQVDVGGVLVRLVTVHTLPPRTAEYAAVWHVQMERLALFAARSELPLLVAADLNATRHHPSYARLLQSGGLRDAHAEVGRAAAWTWPNGVFPLPPMRLDHVLVNDGLAVVAVSEGQSTGSDHKPIVVDIALR